MYPIPLDSNVGSYRSRDCVLSLFVVSSILGPNDSPLFFVVMVPIAIAALTILVMIDFISNMVILALSNKNAMILDDSEIDGFSYGF